VVEREEIEALPNIGRNFVDFVKLSSGVAPGRENVGGGAFKEPDTGVGVAAAPRLSFGGQSELNTLVQVDGADNVQTFTGLPRATPSQEAAQEFRILNSAYLAEYGRAPRRVRQHRHEVWHQPGPGIGVLLRDGRCFERAFDSRPT